MAPAAHWVDAQFCSLASEPPQEALFRPGGRPCSLKLREHGSGQRLVLSCRQQSYVPVSSGHSRLGSPQVALNLPADLTQT